MPVTFDDDEAYALFLILDTAARVERGENPTTGHLREKTLRFYRKWHSDNPGTAHPPLALPRPQGQPATEPGTNPKVRD